MSLRKKIRMQKCGSGERETVLCIFSFAGRKRWREKYSSEDHRTSMGTAIHEREM